MRKYSQLDDREWLGKQLEIKPLREIAAQLGCSYDQVRRAALSFSLRNKKIRRPSLTRIDTWRKNYKKQWPNGRLAENTSNWRGGRQKLPTGYIYIYAPNHPHTSKKKCVMEHRLIMEKKLGRYLQPNEVVHHKNGNKSDNREANLILTKKGRHTSDHFKRGHEVYALKTEIKRLKLLLTKHGVQY